ncbi:hypothetical protein [Phenylobacterium koreense]|uniref:Uncharacterized protein n=1 Tax=Phenylobacterium koreense TaxID=266125 RepID=A0ABV2ENT3_9CAUL
MDPGSGLHDLSAESTRAPEALPVERLVSAGLEATLERFDDPALLSEGKVSVISLEAVSQRFGAKWPVRRSQVYDHVARTLQRHLGVQGYYARVSETDYLIAQPALSRFAGQANCLRYLREILGHFLGEAHLADDGVHQVTRVTQKAVEARKVDARHVEEAERREIAASRPAASGQGRSVVQWSPFVAADGRSLHVSCALEPVYELKSYARIGMRLTRRVLSDETGETLTAAEVANLARADIIRIDIATIARGVERLSVQDGDSREQCLIVPISYTTLSSQRGRAEIVTVFKSARSRVKRGVICEIGDIEGVPHGALASTVSLIRPFALLVVGRIAANAPSALIVQLKGVGLQGLAFECPGHQREAEFAEWATKSIGAAKHVARSVLIYGADSAGKAGLAGVLGASHASLRQF